MEVGRVYNISISRYMGSTRDGGFRKPRDKLEAENSGVPIHAEIRWLDWAKARARFHSGSDGSSSVVAVVLEETNFDRLCRSGVRLLGRRYEIDAYEEAG